MRRSVGFAVITALGIAFTATVAHAATWVLVSNVSEATVTDNTSNNQSGEQLEIKLSTAGSHCGTTKSNIVILRSHHPNLFDHWVRQVQSAKLAGREIKVGSSNAGGTCYTWYITLK